MSVTAVLFFAVIKILIIVGFLMNMGAILTWVERRQMAMIQDRVGPNRAVVYLPSVAVKGLFAGLGLLLAAAAAAYSGVFGFGPSRAPQTAAGISFGLAELAIVVGWIALVIVHHRVGKVGAKNPAERVIGAVRDPRLFFWAGLALQIVLALAHFVVADQGSGEPPNPITVRIGPAVLSLLLLGLGLFGASQVPSGKVGLRAYGLLHPAADGLKFIFKEDFVPPKADKLLHALGPIISVFPVFVTFAVVPFGDTLCVNMPHTGNFFSDLFHAHVGSIETITDASGKILRTNLLGGVARYGTCPDAAVPLQLANLDIGILYMFALAGTGIIGAAIAGWASDNKYALLGGLRASSQMVSYEVALGLSLAGAFMVYGTVRLDDMVRWQSEHAWGIFVQPIAFFLFLASTIAEQKRVPFDAPEGESEIVAGYLLEYSGMKFSMFYLGEYVEVVISSALLTTIFFGGWALPFLHRDGITIAFGDHVLFHQGLLHWQVILAGVLAFFGKTIFVTWMQIFIRWTIPRFRYDQIMALGWRKLLPASLVNMVLTGMVLLAIDRGGVALSNGLDFAADLTQALVAIAVPAGLIWFVSSMLKPVEHRKYVVSSSAREAAARGGTPLFPMQA